MIYLASPYSHPDHAVRQQRYKQVCAAAAAMLRRGLHVFSPIAHSHGIAQCGRGPDWSTWAKFDSDMLSRCDELWVLMLDGWKESRGVAAEITLARELGKPIQYVSPGDEMKAGYLPLTQADREPPQ